MKAKCLCRWFLRSQKVIELRGSTLKRGNGDFALITTHPKLGINNRARKGLCNPMKSMTEGALNIHLSKTVNHPSMIKRLACNRKRRLWWWWKHLKI
jgi:hypothetical protein